MGAVPLDVLHQGQQAAGVTDEFVQEGDDVGELGPMASLLLPAVQHELVQGHGAAHGCRQPVALLDGQNHLQGAEWSSLRGKDHPELQSIELKRETLYKLKIRSLCKIYFTLFVMS